MAASVVITHPELAGDPASGDLTTVLQVVAVPAVIAGWMLLQIAFADSYARLYYETDGEEKPMHFPATPDPNEADFAYYSFTMGTSFASSDVEVRSRPLRYVVLTHSLLAFFYNSAILGVAISVLTQ